MVSLLPCRWNVLSQAQASSLLIPGRTNAAKRARSTTPGALSWRRETEIFELMLNQSDLFDCSCLIIQ